MIKLDELDYRILRVLQKNNRLSYTELADATASSTASCLRRVKKIRQAGIITADICLLDPCAMGETLTVIVNVELERERLDLVDDFKKAMRAADEVTQCYMVTGDCDFVLTVSVRTVADFDAFVKAKLYSNLNVRKFKSMISIDRVKFEPRIKI